jgi:hypothetical protein
LGIDKHSWFIDPQITFSDMLQKQYQSNNIEVTATSKLELKSNSIKVKTK